MKSVLLAAVAAAMFTSPAFAWNNTNAGHGPQSIADGGPSQSQAAVARQHQSIVVNNQVGRAGGAYHGGGSGGTSQMPPDTAVAPSYGTANPCVGAAAGVGAQTPMFGLSFGGQRPDVACQVLRLGKPYDVDAARDYLCREHPDLRQAYADIGHPCLPEQQPKVTPVASKQKPEWCVTTSGIELRNHPECR